MSQAEKPHVIVVGVDYSESGELALDRAIDITASRKDTEIHAVNVVSVLPPATWVGYAPGAALPGIQLDEARAELDRYLAKKLMARRAKEPGAAHAPLPRIVGHIRVEVPAQEIAQLAADLEADLVIVGTHGRRGASRILLGSVAEGVVRLAPCPVLVVREKQVPSIPKIEPPCPECVKTRQATRGEQMWCAQHSERHGQRHTYHHGDRVSSDGTMPLLFHT